MKKFFFLLFLLYSLKLTAQTTLITATVVDSDGITWSGGTWKATFIPNGAYQNISIYNQNGTSLLPSVLYQNGTLDNLGSFTVSLYDSSTITPSGSSWTLTICPLASASCGIYNFKSAGASMNISSALTFTIPVPRFPGSYPNYGYTDIEVTPTAVPGSTYFNVSSQCQEYYNSLSLTWSCVSASTGFLPLTGGVLSGSLGGTTANFNSYTGTSANIGSYTGTSASISSYTGTSANIGSYQGTTYQGTSATFSTYQLGSGTILNGNQGNGTLIQHSSGTTNPNDAVKYDSNGNTISAGFTIIPPSVFSKTTYYLSTTGSDSNVGSYISPWLSPNHSLNCGDVIIAFPGTYSSSNFTAGKWGAVSCSTNNGVAWLQCQTFDTCKISSGGTSSMIITASYWGVQGWENSSTGGPCFGITPVNTSTNIHHIILANNVANGCGSGGFSAYDNGAASVDYLYILGNIAYNAAQSGVHCFSGISIYQPVPTDTNSGTHIYIANNFSYSNLNPSVCNGGSPTDGDGIILDSFDGANPGGGTGVIYTPQVVVENNVMWNNGGRGWEYQTYTKGTPGHPTAFFFNNTTYGNQTDTHATYNICTDGSLLIAYGVLVSKNIGITTATTACTGHTLVGINVYDASNLNTAVIGNLVYTTSGSNITSFNDDGNTAPTTTNNTTGTNPLLAGTPATTAPSCAGKVNTLDCMSAVIAAIVPSAAAAKGLGYQPISSSNSSNSFFPQFLCRIGLPGGITNMSCN